MREGSKSPKWPKLVMRKWLSMKNGSSRDGEFQADYTTKALFPRRKSCSNDGGHNVVVPEELSDEWMVGRTAEIGRSGSGQLNLRMLVGTWNVGGNSPPPADDDDPKLIMDWLMINNADDSDHESESESAAAADIYVLGFQEMVPLNAGNVFGAHDSTGGPAARKWISLIHRALNNNPKHNTNNYCLVASKQMVGIFLCVWAPDILCKDIITSSNNPYSCVGTGIMGRLGNKGSVSISLTLYRTLSLCFVCTHLASGEKEGDQITRNSDVAEILKRTRFSHWPHNILDHDEIVWLGDLNYRLASAPSISHDTLLVDLLENNKWRTLLEKDQLKIEQRAGRVFKDWEEGEIDFAPTYKYVIGSDCYVAAAAAQAGSSKGGRTRTPAWCDRILWKGKGLTQICYGRGESRFSDHRPVYSLFSLQIPPPPAASDAAAMASE